MSYIKSMGSRLTQTISVLSLALTIVSAIPLESFIFSDLEGATTNNYAKGEQGSRSLLIPGEPLTNSSKTGFVNGDGGPDSQGPTGRKVKLNKNATIKAVSAPVASQKQAPAHSKPGRKGQVKSDNIKRASSAGSAFKEGLKEGLSFGNTDFAGDILGSAVGSGGGSVSGQDTKVERGLDKARDKVGNVGGGIIDKVGGGTGTGALLVIPAGIAGVGLGLAVKNSQLGDIRRVMTIVKTGAVVTGQQDLIGLQKKQNQGLKNSNS